MSRRSVTDLAPRVELLPLIDVIFLLLTYFIYSMTVMVHAELMPVELTPLEHGQAAESQPALSITLDRDGELFINREPIRLSDLAQNIADRLEEDPEMRVFLALEEDETTTTDRGPLLIRVVETLRQAGVQDLAVVGGQGN
ncbi:ExbD/TolR family protein [Mucisphaera calidilacus]|uniref:Biopolymer transport protein ExbD/TolR n=1 Tax=Mucisphaera calidilacus TaxID=2527982 RepID=A0A518BZV1_9BACT|nr:biopolymer transporter ExbD [Mucisphaera calidilacus]QDU72500.1 Biopolymer transport protein ExbD/TolR [Mucisphaera calidilacus]